MASHVDDSSSTKGTRLADPGEAGGPAAGNSSGAGGAAGEGGGPEAYRVTLHATQAIVCSGQCTAISAEAEHGHAPYSYVWNGTVGEGPGPHTVCPTQTSTYAVSASDTALGGDEFGRPSQSASATLEIQVLPASECALDGGLPTEQPEGTVLCSIELPYEDEGGYPLLPSSLGSGRTLATDNAGNLYFTGTYTASFDLGDGVTEDEPTRAVFVAKYDAACGLMWSRRFSVEGHSVSFSSIAIGPNREVVTAGTLLGSVMFDEHLTAVPGDGPNGMVVASFDPDDGSVLWARADDTTFDSAGTYQVAIDDSGDIVLAGWASQYQTIDGVPLATSLVGAFVAKMSSAGEYRFAHVIGGSEPYLRIALSPTGTIAMSTLLRENVATYDGIALDYEALWHRNAAVIDPDGTLLWNRDMDADLQELNSDVGIGAVMFDHSGALLVEHGDYVLESNGMAVPKRISKLDAAGAELWTREVSPPGYQKKPFNQGTFALDSRDNIIITDEIDNSTDSGDDAGIRAEDKDPNDVIVRKLNAHGEPRWQRVFDTDVFEMAWGLTVGPDDSIWVGHGRDADANPYRGTLRITKLAP